MSDLRPHQYILRGEVPQPPTAQALGGAMDDLLRELAMIPICPIIIRIYAPEWGAFVMIAESHIHVWGVGREAWGDVFSCKPFDVETVIDIVKRHLGGEWRHGRPELQSLEISYGPS